MDSQIINWGIIGAGKIATKFATDLLTVTNCKLYAIASRTVEKAESFKQKFKAQKAYGTYEDLVLDTNIHAIYIATPHSFHKQHTLLCLQHNIPVLCEKPFAINLEEVESMIKRSKEKGILLMEALWTAYLPHFKYVKQLVREKYFGDVIQLNADFGFKTEFNEGSRVFNKSLGGGSLLDIGIYPIFTALSILGKPKAIQADATFYSNGVDSSCSILFDYNKAKAFLKCTFLEETKTEAIFYCEKGTIIIHGRFHQPSTVTLIDQNGNDTQKSFDYTTMGYSYEIEHFNQLLRTNKTESNIMTFNKSRELIATLDNVRAIIGLDYK